MKKFLNKKIGIIIMFIIIFSSLIYYLYKSGLLDPTKITEIVEGAGIWAPILFAIIYILITTLGISAAAFTILAGTLFGTSKGLIIVVISATIAAVIAFYISRFFRDKVLTSGKDKKKEEKGILNNMIKKIEDNADKNGFLTICILRLAFLPYIPLSYAAGLVKNLKATDFTLATLITNIFGSFVFIFLGDRIGELLKGNFDIVTVLTLIGAIVLLVLFIKFVPKIVGKFQK